MKKTKDDFIAITSESIAKEQEAKLIKTLDTFNNFADKVIVNIALFGIVAIFIMIILIYVGVIPPAAVAR